MDILSFDPVDVTSPAVTMNESVVTATSGDDLAVTTQSQLVKFSQWYQAIHGYVCIVVCSFGIAANIMNVIVLTRRNMVISQT